MWLGDAGVAAAPAFVSDREVALVISSASWVSVSLVRVFSVLFLAIGNKKPPPTIRSHEGRASTQLGLP
jgi:hypothetical protein